MTADTLTIHLNQYGIILVFIVVLLEYMNLPGFPSGVIMPIAGLWCLKTNNSFLMLLIVSTVAGLLGSLILYYIGKRGGRAFLRKYMNRFPSQKSAIKKCMGTLKKHDKKTIFLSKLMPMLRTIISIPAGVVHMNLKDYVLYSTLGILVWNGTFMYMGYYLGDKIYQFI